jgi:hypothetical protein
VERPWVGVSRRPITRRADQLGQERSSIQAGIDLVACGAARRVTLSGLRFAERLLPDAIERGALAGVSVRLDRPDDAAPALILTSGSFARHN